MKPTKRVLREEVVEDADGKVTSRKTTLEFSKEPAYVKLYFDCLGVYIKNEGLTSSLNEMLIEVLKRSSYAEEGQIVHLDKFTKEQVCKATGKSMERMKQAIRTWEKNGILTRVNRGVYEVNPFIFGKGDWRNIAKLRATFRFDQGIIEVVRQYNPIKEEEQPTTPPPVELPTVEAAVETVEELERAV